VIQSSSVTTALTVQLVDRGIITLTQAVGVILGANVGTTATAELVAFVPPRLASIFVITGLAVIVSSSLLPQHGHFLRTTGEVVVGVGLILLGVENLAKDLKIQAGAFIAHFGGLNLSLFMWMLIGAAATAIVHSSAAITSLCVAMAETGTLPLEFGIPIVIGSNVGTCVTAYMAAIGRGQAAWRTANVHFLFNLGGALIVLPFLRPAIIWLTGLPEPASQVLAHTHVIFNLVTAVAAVPFSPQLARWASWGLKGGLRGK
jgi:phosphate:Na+ symporter